MVTLTKLTDTTPERNAIEAELRAAFAVLNAEELAQVRAVFLADPSNARQSNARRVIGQLIAEKSYRVTLAKVDSPDVASELAYLLPSLGVGAVRDFERYIAEQEALEAALQCIPDGWYRNQTRRDFRRNDPRGLAELFAHQLSA